MRSQLKVGQSSVSNDVLALILNQCEPRSILVLTNVLFATISVSMAFIILFFMDSGFSSSVVIPEYLRARLIVCRCSLFIASTTRPIFLFCFKK